MSKPDVAAERKNQIVRATIECITKFGYNNFSMQDVAKAAGVSKGIIHYYFLNKDELMMSVLESVAGDIESVLMADTASIADPVKKLEAFVRICFDIVRSTKEYYQVNIDFWTQINQKDEVRGIIAKHYGKFRESCAKVVQNGMDRGVFKRNISAAVAASYIIAVVDGFSLQWLFDDKIFDWDATIAGATRLIIDGLKA